MGNLVRQQDALGQATTTEYDSLGRAITVTDANQDGTHYQYDQVGNLRFLTDASGNTTEWKYDKRGQVVEEKDALGHSHFYLYDQEGRLYRHTDRNGRVTQYGYDVLGQCTSETWINGGRTITYSYYKSGDLAQVADAGAVYGYEYDDRGQLIEQAQSLAGLTPVLTLASTYDNEQRRTGLQLQVDGTDTVSNQYDYDDLGRLIHLQSGAGEARKWVEYVWDAASRLDSSQTRLGVSQVVFNTDYTFDNASRLTGLVYAKGTLLASYDWAYDQAHRLTSELYDTAVSAARSVTYGYDATGQVTSAAYDDSQSDEGYTYDDTGNRTNTGYATDTGNRLTAPTRTSTTTKATAPPASPTPTRTESFPAATRRSASTPGTTATG